MTETAEIDEDYAPVSVEDYAVKLVHEGAESRAEDDMNEDGDIDDAGHEQAMDLAIDLAHVIRDHRDTFLSWAKPHLPDRSRASLAEV